MTYSTRPITQAEQGLLFSSYVRSTWQRGNAGSVNYTEHCAIAHARMEAMMNDPHVETLCVVDDDAPGWVGGWAIWHPQDDGQAVHWMYVRRDYRRLGLARMMLGHIVGEGEQVYATHPHPRWREQSERLNVRRIPLAQAMRSA